jgi:hypothetical protein
MKNKPKDLSASQIGWGISQLPRRLEHAAYSKMAFLAIVGELVAELLLTPEIAAAARTSIEVLHSSQANTPPTSALIAARRPELNGNPQSQQFTFQS